MASLQKLSMLSKTPGLRVQFQPNWVSNSYRVACPRQIALSVQVTPKYAISEALCARDEVVVDFH